ncbi:DUF2177 family protein [Pseudoroseicyclus aestuarii]|uniref:Putative membrane protein n=1 Tax=Pseudoroseicyclus aestuarii TaxID=1795041 RepID=A0A318SU67_9RHOB|nr:DUF2177 family protein [Pseudoroseicyclus aestuarii]PYE83786.1 putative membrane protein [Pseudoroseicyclus aestuarii]
MQAAILYVVTAAVFLAADALMLRQVMQPLFQRHIGDWLAEPIRMGPAVGFYLAYVAAICWLVSWPALQADAPGRALLNGAILGAAAYGTYEFTNYATLTRWSLQQVAVDLSWGIALTGVSALVGVLVARWIAG